MLFFFQAEDGIRDLTVTGVQTCALPISQGLHQRAVLRGHRYFGADGKEGGARAPIERNFQEQLNISLYQEPMTCRLWALVLTAVPNIRKSRKPLFSQYFDCINLALCDSVTH